MHKRVRFTYTIKGYISNIAPEGITPFSEKEQIKDFIEARKLVEDQIYVEESEAIGFIVEKKEAEFQWED